MISIEDVSFGYSGEHGTLHDVTLKIRDGECILLCGESGCGKTTVTKLMNGLVPHFTDGCALEGRVSAEGLAVAETELYELAKRVGSVFQNPKSQFFNLDSDSELAFGLENQGAAPDFIRTRLKETVRNLRMEALQGRSIFSMSGGEKQMLAFASVYAMDPAVFVLDEPTANLDEDAVKRLREQLRFLKRQGHTVVIAEHRLWFLDGLIDRAVFLKNGRIERSFSGGEFFSLPERERIDMGLRALTPPDGALPPALPCGAARGLSVEGLACGFGKGEPVLRALSFSAVPGEILAVSGKNGIGKTTLTRCLCGLMRERAGTVRLNGRRLNRKQRAKAAFCVMQDVNHQLFSDSVFGECLLAAPECTDERVKEVLNRFDLLPFEEKHPMALSGGQKQRLAIATAVLSGKELLIFDEPTSGLDYAHMMEVSSVVRQLADEGRVVLIVTHDREFLRCACDRELELREEGL